MAVHGEGGGDSTGDGTGDSKEKKSFLLCNLEYFAVGAMHYLLPKQATDSHYLSNVFLKKKTLTTTQNVNVTRRSNQ